MTSPRTDGHFQKNQSLTHANFGEMCEVKFNTFWSKADFLMFFWLTPGDFTREGEMKKE